MKSDDKIYAYGCQCCKCAFVTMLTGDFVRNKLCDSCYDEIISVWFKSGQETKLSDFVDAYIVRKELIESEQGLSDN